MCIHFLIKKTKGISLSGVNVYTMMEHLSRAPCFLCCNTKFQKIVSCNTNITKMCVVSHKSHENVCHVTQISSKMCCVTRKIDQKCVTRHKTSNYICFSQKYRQCVVSCNANVLCRVTHFQKNIKFYPKLAYSHQ